jgi:glycogen debranching enzyme
MSYHDGSVWPHDNALVAGGLALYGFKDYALKILMALFDASIFLDLHRLPELFCGFNRRPGEGPTLYPVACAPQSWAAGAVFSLLASCIGISIDGRRKQVAFRYPRLPEAIPQLQINELRVGDEVVDLSLERLGKDVSVMMSGKQGEVELSWKR